MTTSQPTGAVDTDAGHDQLHSAMRQVVTAHDALLRAADMLRQTSPDPLGDGEARESYVDVALAQAIFRGAGYLNALADTLATAMVRRNAAAVPADGSFEPS